MRMLMITMLLGLAACSSTPADPTVEHAWVKLSAVQGQPAAAYFTLRGGAKDDALVNVTSPEAGSAMFHETETKPANNSGMGNMADMPGMSGMSGMSMMKPLMKILVPAKSKVTLAPGGIHVMLMDPAPNVKAGDYMHLTLHFHNGVTRDIDAKALEANSAPPQF